MKPNLIVTCLAVALLGVGYYLGQSAAAKATPRLGSGQTATLPRGTGGDVAAMARENTTLKADIARLTAEVVSLNEAATKPVPPPAPANPSASPEARAKALADGQAFLSQNLEAQQILRNLGKAQAGRNYAQFGPLFGISPAQVEELENQTVEFLLGNSLLQGTSISVGSGELPEAQAKVLLGDEGYQHYLNYRRLMPLVGSVNNVAGLLTREPLTAEQSTQLVKAMVAANGAYQSGATADYPSTNWNQVYAEARNFLSPAQMNALQAQTQSPRLAPLVRQYVQNQEAGK